MDDGEIIQLYWERSETALSATAAKYAKYCFRVAHNILRDDGDAEECVSDTYLRVWEAIPPARPDRLSAFLGKITRNLALNRLEKRRAEKRNFGHMDVTLAELEECIPDQRLSVEQMADTEIITKTLNAFLAGLSQTHCKIFLRRYWFMILIPL